MFGLCATNKGFMDVMKQACQHFNSLSGAVRPSMTALIRGAARPAAVIAATSGTPATVIPITIIIAGETVRGTALLCFHLVRGLIETLTERY